MDIRTLYVVNLVLLALYAVTMLVNTLTSPGYKGSHWFTLCNAIGAVAMLLALFRGRAPDFLTIIVANFLVMVGFLLLHCALTEFLERSYGQLRIQAGMIAVTMSGFFYFTYVHNSIFARIEILNLLLTAQVGMSAWLMFRHSKGRVRVSCWLTGSTLALFSLGSFAHALLLWKYGAPAQLMDQNTLQSGSLLLSTIANAGMMFGFLWMTAARLQESLEVQARTDALTGVLNRRALTEEAEREIARSRRSQEPLSILMMDLDSFKQTNDLLGHSAGDEALRAVANVLKHSLRQQDVVARFGGDEFVAILPETKNDAAQEIAERLLRKISSLQLAWMQGSVCIQASFGVASLKGPEDTWEELLQRCDRSLYAAKYVGGNYIATASSITGRCNVSVDELISGAAPD